MTNRFDSKAKEMDEHPVIRDSALAFAKTLRNYVQLDQRMTVLDVGCGSGLVGMHLYQDVGKLVMLDNSEGMLGILRDRFDKLGATNVEADNSDTYALTADGPIYDLIYVSKVLHHIEDVEGFLSGLTQVLAPGGQLCLGDLDTEPGTFHDDNTGVYHFGFDVSELTATLKSLGLVNTRSETYYTVTKPDQSGTMREYPMFFLTALKQ